MVSNRTSPDGHTDINRLRQRIREMEGTALRLEAGDGNRPGIVRFDIPQVDDHLPWGGLPLGAFHEVIAKDAGAATGFSAALAGGLTRMKGGPVLWCEGNNVLDAGEIYGPGLSRYGLSPDRMILVRARRDEDVLWAMEEGLGCPELAAVVGETRALSLTAGRRLQLAAAASGVTALLLKPRATATTASAAMTRWRVDTVHPDGNTAEPGLGRTRWRVELTRCRAGTTSEWTLEWLDETCDFALAATVCDRPVVSQPPRLAG